MNTRSVLNISYYIYDQVFHAYAVKITLIWYTGDSHIMTHTYTPTGSHVYGYTFTHTQRWTLIISWLYLCVLVVVLPMDTSIWLTYAESQRLHAEMCLLRTFSVWGLAGQPGKKCHQCKCSIPVIHTRTVWLLTYVALLAPLPAKS